MAQVFALAAAIDQRYRALVLLASFGSLRWANSQPFGGLTSIWTLGWCGSPVS